MQTHLPESLVVKGFNNIYFDHLAALGRPSGDPERSVPAIAGDDHDAKHSVTHLLDSLGYDAYDAGPLAEGWRFQHDTAAYAAFYNGQPDAGWPPPAGSGRRVTVDLLEEKPAAAQRYADLDD